MDSPSILPILQKIPIFKDLNADEHAQIIKNIVLNYFPVGHAFFNEGDAGATGMFIIKRGMVRISRKNPVGETAEVAVLTDGDFFGEMALVLNEPRNATATAVTDCEVFQLSKEDFMKLMQSNPTMANKISKEFLSREKKNHPSTGL